LLIHRTKRET